MLPLVRPVRRCLAPLLLSAALGIAWGPAAGAVTIFSNLGPGDSFNTTDGVTVGSFFGAKSERAVSFTPSQAVFVNSVEVALRALTGSPDVTILLTESAPGGSEPGGFSSALETAQVLAPSSASLLTGTFSGTALLEAGMTYWIWLSAPSSGDATGWFMNDIGSVQPWGTSKNNGVDWTSSEGPAPAIRINGTLVPEPGTAALVGLGMLAFGIRGRR